MTGVCIHGVPVSDTNNACERIDGVLHREYLP